MPTPCNNYVIPIFEEDLCQGEVKSAACVKDSSIYTELSLEANSTQQQINQAQYLAALNIKAQTENLQIQVDNIVLSNQVGDNTNIASALNVGSMRYRVSGNNSYFDMVMQVSASTYEWVNVVQQNW